MIFSECLFSTSSSSTTPQSMNSSAESIPFNSLFDGIQPGKPATAIYKKHFSASTQRLAAPDWTTPSLYHAVLKIGNISWDTLNVDIVEILGVSPDQVHIPIDRATGKTKSDMFVELPDPITMLNLIGMHNRRVLKGRSLIMLPSSIDELYHSHFGHGGCAFIDSAEAHSLLNICRNYKVYFSRKCAERPFEHVISILRLAPWFALEDSQVSLLHELCCEACKALQAHIDFSSCKKTCPPSLNSSLLARLKKASSDFPAFTQSQRSSFLED